jgi:putative ABC transport system permease protein
MRGFARELRLALRRLARERAFSAAALLTLALGVGAAAAMLTVVDAVLWKELPYRDPSRLVMLEGVFRENGEVKSWPVSQLDFADWRRRSTVFSAMSVYGGLAYNLEQGQQSQRLSAELVDDAYFPLLGLAPAAGRFFTAEEDARPMEQYVVVLGYDLWHGSFGGDPAVVGRTLRFNGTAYRVVGVGPRGFHGLSDHADLWVPSMVPPIRQFLTLRRLRWVGGVARLAPGVSPRQAQQQMDSVTAALARELPDSDQGLGAAVTPLKEFWFGKLRSALLVLSAGAGALLLIACINVAGLQLTRAIARQRDFGLRVALGASRGRLARELLAESLLLALAGAACGLAGAQWATGALIAAAGPTFPSFVAVRVAPEVVLATAGLALAAGLACGLAPLWVSWRADLTRSLGRGEPSAPRGTAGRRFQSAVVIAQVALALTLAVDAGLMARSFRRLLGQELGFRRAGLLTFRLDMRGPKYYEDAEVTRLLRQEYLPRLAALPGVASVALADPTIPTDELVGGYITVEDHASAAPDGTYLAMLHAVSPGFFDILGVPVLRGRSFDGRDTNSNAVIVSQAMADAQWPGRDPIGRRLKLGARGESEVPWLTVVGVAANVRHEGIRGERAPAPDIYQSLLQFIRRPPLTINVLVRPRPGVSTAQLRRALHREIMAIDPELPDYDTATLEERLARQTAKARFQVVLIGTFTALALALAAVGIYGVVSYDVTQRRREIAIRMSVGASRRDVLRLVLARGALLGAIGLALGLATVFATRAPVESLLFDTSIADPVVLGGACLGLFVVTLAANYLPARRAAVADPVAGLRLQ